MLYQMPMQATKLTTVHTTITPSLTECDVPGSSCMPSLLSRVPREASERSFSADAPQERAAKTCRSFRRRQPHGAAAAVALTQKYRHRLKS